MFILSNIQKLCLLSGCVGLLGIVIIMTICCVCPGCWMNNKITKKQKRALENKMKNLQNNFQMSIMDKDPPPPYDSSTRTSFINLRSPEDRRLVSINSVSSACSDTDSVTGIPLPLLSDTAIPAIEIPDTSPFEQGNVSVSLQYKKITGEDRKPVFQLRVDLKEAGDLPTRAYGGRCNPYFTIGLYDTKNYNKKKRRRSVPRPLHEFHSTIVKKSQHPVFNESFFFPFESNNLKKCILRIVARDEDKLVNDTVLGEANFHLKDVATSLYQEPPKELDLNLKLEDSKMNDGQLLLGLCYLPTAERITLTVLKANNLKKANQMPEEADFYVQAMAVYGGKMFERRKTSRRPISQFPVFNEMLMFDVPFTKLDHVVLLVAVYFYLPQASTSAQESHPKLPNKETCVGKVIIGTSGRKHSSNHWNAMRSSPRRQVIQWHELR